MCVCVYLDNVVDSENRLSPLHRVDRVLLQTPLLLLQQAVEHRGDLGDLWEEQDTPVQQLFNSPRHKHTEMNPAESESYTHLPEEDVGGSEAGRHGDAVPLQRGANGPVDQLGVLGVVVLQHHGRLQLLGVFA